MAYYAASSPPPPKAPSLAPTTATELSNPIPPPPPPDEKKKKKSFAKRVLKELAGGGGNNPSMKGQPVVRPYGRGGVGVKPQASKTSLPSSSSQKSPPPSLHQSQSSLNNPAQSPPPPKQQEPENEIDEHEGYAFYDYDDDQQSTVSRIPAPKRTRQWIQQHAQQQAGLLPSPPNSNGGPPSSIYSGGGGGGGPRGDYSLPHSPPLSYTQGSQYSSTPSQDTYYQQLYGSGYAPSTQGGRSRLQNLDEDALTNDFTDHFGRLDVNAHRGGAGIGGGYPSPTSISSRTRPGTAPPSSVSGGGNSSVSSRTPATYRTTPQQQHYVSSPPPPQPVRAESAGPQSGGGSGGQYDAVTAQVLQQYLAQHGISPNPQNLLDQHRAQHTQMAQTRELQSQIDSLREAERKARERLEALRKEAPASMKKDDGRLDIMSAAGGAMSDHPASEVASTVDTSASAAAIRSAIVVGGRQGEPSIPPVPRPLTTQERALLEKEKLRQRDLERERERELRERAASPTASTSTYAGGMQTPGPPNPLAALLAVQQQQQLLAQNPLLAQFMQPQMQMPAAPVGYPPAQPGLDGQQQLIMQLGALLLQQQQQLQMLAAGRAAAPPESAPQPPTPGLDLTALLTLGAALPGAQNNLAALLQQQQQAQQIPPQPMYSPPVLTTTAPSPSLGFGGSQSGSSSVDPPSPATASSTSIIHPSTTTGTSLGRSSPNPMNMSPKHREAMGIGLGNGSGGSGAQASSSSSPLRLEGLRGVGGSFMSSFNRELGLTEDDRDHTATQNGAGAGAEDDGAEGSGSRERSIPPQRSSPPRAPLPDLPASRAIPMMRRGPDSGMPPVTVGGGTPPPAYMSR